MSHASSREFREVLRNRLATGFAVVPLLASFFQLLFGVIFAALSLVSVTACLLALSYTLLGLDPFSIKAAFEDIPSGIKGVVALLAALLFTLLFFGTMAYWCLRPVKRRLSARLYVLSGRELRCVEGAPTYDESSERGTIGVEVEDFYFSFDDCWLNADERDIARLRAAGGTLRVWYIPEGLRSWTNPGTGKTVRYDGILVRAEWRP